MQPTITIETSTVLTPLMQKLLKEKESARKFQERRHDDWNENYDLFRNKVKTNRLTQRQAVNVPLMKETIKTLLSKIDDPPMIEWEEKGGDEVKEAIMQTKWDTDFERLNMEGIDIQDKKNVMLYGRGVKKLDWDEDGCRLWALDIYDTVIDPLVDPNDLETARFIIHQNIFRPLQEVLADERFTPKGKQELKTWLTSQQGLIQSSSNRREYEKKLQRIKDMGMPDHELPSLVGGDVLVDLTEHHTNTWNAGKKDFERRVVIYANDAIPLLDELAVDCIGVDFYPFVSWGEDMETNDFWSDGPGDLIRVPNKVLNVWFSQLIENRTLRNFQMHWFAPTQGYQPQVYEPGPGRLLPAPKPAPGQSIRDVIMPVEISGLDEDMTVIDWITQMVERGTAATALEKGVAESRPTTLGEVEILVGKATERLNAMAKFYRRSWDELAWKWYRLLEANQTKSLTLYKRGGDGKLWPKTAYPVDWRSKAGYKPIVRSSSEREQEKTKAVQRFQFLLSQFPQNQALRIIAQKRMLEVADFTPEELRQVEEAQKKADEQQQMMIQQQQQTQDLTGSIKRRLGALQTLQPPTTVTPQLANAIAPSPVVPNINGI